jgi:protein TonB
MSTPALALPKHRIPRVLRRRRRALNRFPLQWHEVPVAESPAFAGHPQAVRLRWLIAMVTVVVLFAHALGVWLGNRVPLDTEVKPSESTLAIELVRPPKPLPKVDPPPPPKRTPPKAPPPIQTAAPTPSEAPITAPVQTVATVAPAEPAPSAPPPETVKPAFGGIGYQNNPPPDYPAQAARQGWQGTVLLRVQVLKTGAVASIEVVKSSGRKVLDDAAIHTVERWVFAPSTRGDTPIEGFATVPIEFKLDS